MINLVKKIIYRRYNECLEFLKRQEEEKIKT